MRSRSLVGPLSWFAVLWFAAGTVAAQQAAPAQPAADPSTTQPTSAQTGASPPPGTAPPEPTAQPSSGDPATDPQAQAATAAATPADASGATAAPAAPVAMPEAVIVDWTATKPGDAKAGEAKAAVCGACHGLDGNAADAMYPKIAGQHEWYTARQLALYKSGERQNPIMQGFAAPLSPQDMRDLGAFFATKAVAPGVANDALVVADGDETWVAHGERLYRSGNEASGTPSCMACHGPSGRGNPGAKYPALAGQHTDYTKAKLTEFRDGAAWGRGANASPIMAQVAKTLSDADIEALSTYLEGLHPAMPTSTAAAAATTASQPTSPPAH
ncbi:MAG TPA: c-type cytochrome [Candidatus Saccharimonadia bacterium]|nr:c-type cytochrome [Candidatus Saccharimonadia bacterium]